MPERVECSWKECLHEGQFSIKLMIPHRRLVGEDPRPFESILGIRLCRKHAEEFPASNILDAPDERNLKAMLEHAPSLTGGPLDFGRAYTLPLRCSSEEYQTFLRIQGAQRRPPAG